MKTTLLITFWILLVNVVIASPVPQVSLPRPRSHNDDIDGITITPLFPRSSKPLSGTSPARTKRANPDDSDTDTYTFDKTINGDGITLGLGQPRTLPDLDWFPKGWRLRWDLRILEGLARDLSQRYGNIIKQIKNDEDEIWKAIAFVQGKDTAETQRYRQRVIERKVPAFGDADYRGELIEMITKSRLGVRRAIDERNATLRLLSEIKTFRNIATPHTPNAYVTFWMENQIQLQPMAAADHLPESEFLIGKNQNGDDLTAQIGKPMVNLSSLPKGWKKFKTANLIDIANEISTMFPPIRRKVMDDQNEIIRAISALKGNTSRVRTHKGPGRLRTYRLPEKGNSAGEYRKQLITMIQLSRLDLQDKVSDRNGFLKKLDELQVSPDDVGNADPTNRYVAYWKESHGLPANHMSGTNPTARESSSGASKAQPTPNRKRPAQPGVAGVSSSKRPKTPSTQPDHVNESSDSDSALNEMLEEIETALQRNVPSSGSPNPSTPGNLRGRPDAGVQHVVGSPFHGSDLPATPWTASSTTAGTYNPPVPVDPALTQHCQEAHKPYNEDVFFNFEAYEGSPCQGERKSVTGKE